MAWSASRVFTQFVANPGLATLSGATKPTGFTSITADALKVALYNNSGTPNGDSTLANTAYGVDQWVTGNEVTSSTQWPAGGEALSGLAVANGTGTWSLTASTTSSGSAATLANVYGDLVYDNSISAPTAKQGIGYHYYGGANSVVAGTFSIVWNASGVIEFTN